MNEMQCMRAREIKIESERDGGNICSTQSSSRLLSLRKPTIDYNDDCDAHISFYLSALLLEIHRKCR